jgi:hypothetical protein
MKFVISYAYDVPNFADFLVDAKDENEALEKAQQALSSGRFAGVKGQPDDSIGEERVFVLRASKERDDDLELI